MPKAVKLTKAFIKGAPAGDHPDTVQTGLVLRVRKKAKHEEGEDPMIRALYVRGRLGKGRSAPTRLSKIGDASLDLGEARSRASEYRAKLSKGVDPAEEQKQQTSGGTVRNAAQQFLEEHAKGFVSEKAIAGYVNNYIIPELGTMVPAHVTRAHIIRMVEKVAAEKPRTATVLLQYTKLMFERFYDLNLITENPAAMVTPKKIKVAGKRKPLKPSERTRFLSDEEIIALWGDVDGLREVPQLLLKTVLATGQRPKEVAQMYEAQIDGRWWTIPAEVRGKTKDDDTVGDHTVYLNDLALDLIDTARAKQAKVAKRRGRASSGLLFEGQVWGQPYGVDALSKALSRVDDQLTLPSSHKPADVKKWEAAGHLNWRAHDLRRTLKTRMSDLEVSSDVGKRILGHKIEGVERAYDQSEHAEAKRKAMTKYGEHLDKLIGIDRGNVLRLEA